jgi:hypothetical protein
LRVDSSVLVSDYQWFGEDGYSLFHFCNWDCSVRVGRKESVSRFENALDAELPDASQIADALLQGVYAYLGYSILINIAGKFISQNPW